MDVMVTHKTGTTGGWLVGEIKQHHVGIGMLADDVETSIVARCNQLVVGIHKLQIFAGSHLDTCVAGHTQSLMLLSQINHFIGITLEGW